MLLNKRIPVKYLLGTIKWELLIVMIWAAIVMYFDEYIKMQNMGIPIQIPTILGTTISLILAFRTSQSYERWWEARKIWGAIVNDSRSLVRQAIAFPKEINAEVKALQKKIGLLQIEWCFSLAERLRNQHSEVKDHQLIKEWQHVFNHSNVPNAILTETALTVNDLKKAGQLDDYQYIKLQDTIQRLTDSMGKAERIKFTIFPKLYSMFVDFFLYVFIVVLPFGIIEYFSFMEGPLIVVVSISFLILEKTAILLQDPFANLPTDIPIRAISRTIQGNILEMLGEPPSSEHAEEVTFYQM